MTRGHETKAEVARPTPARGTSANCHERPWTAGAALRAPPNDAEASGSARSAAKASIVALTRNAAVEYAQEGIRVNVVSPGIIEPDRSTADSQLDEPERPRRSRRAASAASSRRRCSRRGSPGRGSTRWSSSLHRAADDGRDAAGARRHLTCCTKSTGARVCGRCTARVG
ncbi:SDR family oxidoreductase [Sorangium sp. So ce321]|uniref:SDR family oxidoreductase n=1 Tax=Sorangium sp. So ce321 TaxID=3133300 RepID=UPI003F60856C